MEVIEYIPEKYEDGFRALSYMNEADFKSILSELSSASLTSSLSTLAKNLSRSVNVSIEEIKDILFSIESLVPLLDKQINKDDIVGQISDVINKSDIIEFSENNTEEAFKNRLKSLLESEKIYYVSKANDLVTDSGVAFLASRVTTDIRPIFEKDTAQPPKVGIITHTLQIHYRSCDNSNHQTIFLSLDSSDIFSLKETLERAIAKEKTLVTLVEKAGMTSITV